MLQAHKARPVIAHRSSHPLLTGLRLAAAAALSALLALPATPTEAQVEIDAERQLRTATQKWVGQQLAVEADNVQVGALDARARVQPCRDISFDFPFPSKETVRARCASPKWLVYLRVGVSSEENALFASRTIAAGAVISENDLTMGPTREKRSSALRDAAQAVGKTTRREIRRGELLAEQDLEAGVSGLRMLQALKAGTLLTPDTYRLETIPAGRAPGTLITRIGEGETLQLNRDVPAGHLLVREDLRVERTAIVARRTIPAGSIIKSDMVDTTEMDAKKLPADYLQSAEGIELSEANRTLQAGQVLRGSDLRPALLVKRGESVTLTVQKGSLELSVQVEALHDARMNEKVRLRNSDSGKVFSGIVTGRGSARAM